MKIACRRCASMKVEDAPRHPEKLRCKGCGLVFAPEDGLVRLSDVVSLGQAVAHPTRLRILLEYGRHPEMSASEVTRRLGLKSVATARYHIQKLVESSPPYLAVGRTAKNHGATEHKFELIQERFANS